MVRPGIGIGLGVDEELLQHLGWSLMRLERRYPLFAYTTLVLDVTDTYKDMQIYAKSVHCVSTNKVKSHERFRDRSVTRLDGAYFIVQYMAGETHAHAFAWHCSIISSACCLGARTPTTTFPTRLCAISITPTSSFSRLPFTAQGTPPPLHSTPHRALFRPSKPSVRHAAISFHPLPSPRTTPPPPYRVRKFLH